MTNTFEWIMAVICIVCAALLLSGHGDGLMKMFGSASSSQMSMKVEKKRTKEEELLYQRVLGLYCALLAVCEVVMALFGSLSTAVPIISIVVGIGGLVAVVAYVRRRF